MLQVPSQAEAFRMVAGNIQFVAHFIATLYRPTKPQTVLSINVAMTWHEA